MIDLLLEQEKLEANLLAEGVQRFKSRLERARRDSAGSTEGAGRALFGKALLRVAPAIQVWIDEGKTTKGPKHIALSWINKIGVEKSAYIVSRAVLDHIYSDINTRKLVLRIAEIVLDELRFRKLEAEAPGLFKYKLERFSTDHYGYKKAVLNQAIRWSEVDVSEFEISEKVRLHIGAKLLGIFVEVTGLVEHVSIRVPGKGRRSVRQSDTIRPTQDTLAMLRQRNEWLEDMAPTRAPLVVPPLPWNPGTEECQACRGYSLPDPEVGMDGGHCVACNDTGYVTLAVTPEPGGYLYALKGTVKLIRGLPRAIRKRVEPTVNSGVCAALNVLQETGWRVNTHVLGVLHEALEGGGQVAGLPGMEPEPLPAKPADIDTNDDSRRAWRRSAALVHERNRSETGQRFEALKAISLAQQYSEYEALFFVWNLDFRGRIYPVADSLQPQGSDVSRGLLEFSVGVSLGSDGAWWLALHGANCLGEYVDHNGQTIKISHLTLEDRVLLINSCSEVICRVAEDPWREIWWQQAEDPWQFLAFCFEWSDFLATGRSDNFISHLVCHVDGTANGLQHFSALLRDEIGADAVNMTARQEPSDIYQRVADTVRALLWKETDPEAKPFADLWINSPVPVDRKLVKRPTMTSAYGSGRFGFADQILDYLRSDQDAETWRACRRHFVLTIDEKQREVYVRACRYMAGLIWIALERVVSGAFKVMSWLQASSRETTKRGKLTEWTVPISGMLVVQPYVDYDSIQVRTVIAGQAWVPKAYQARLDKPVAHEQANGVSPNFIHSLDAVALQTTIVRACQQGAGSFAAIHDSFGSHAGHMAQISHTLREAFVYLHRGQILDNLREEWEIDAELPQQGTYNLNEVMSADYFFC